MSQIVTSQTGRFRRVLDSEIMDDWLFECPKCKEWLRLDWNATGVAHLGCGFNTGENMGAALVAAMQAAILFCEPPYSEDEFPDEGPYCVCDAEPVEDEQASNVCSACGKLLS